MSEVLTRAWTLRFDAYDLYRQISVEGNVLEGMYEWIATLWRPEDV
ncbi:hypothetical protein [Dyella caseinilytica]|uniref:Uncharacterized protein n=1 Tax=Dyella caseinilytica TaxID=1849581 RepID=A0ABX7GPA8_9GAMM|nr:hypothetical protein [Dyella caseinilytica]QRN52264.1 hypothetical protein ISN74_12265 [Dyella caseinilytica]